MGRCTRIERALTAPLRAAAASVARQWQRSAKGAGLEHLKDAHWQITESEARLRELLDNQQELIVRRDDDGRVLFVNTAYCQAFAISFRDIAGRPFRPPVLATEVLPVQSGAHGRRCERLETSRGPRWILWEEHRLVSHTRGHDVLCVGRDVTDERCQAEAVREARDQAEHANRAKSRFLASMSHEIRTPMNGILGMTSLLNETEQTEEQRSYTCAIDQSARALLALIDEILDFSKIEAGKIQLAAGPFSLATCVQNALQLLEQKAAAKNIALTCHIAPDVPQLMIGDAPRVRQIVLNLVSNAVKFTDTGMIAVNVRRLAHASVLVGSAFYEIVVRDTGIGMAPDMMSMLFIEFEQADAGNGRRQSGSGLGLAISRRLARAMGGDIRAESALGRGATFTAVLRLCDAPDVVEVLAAPDAVKFPLAPSRFGAGAPHILIAEDNDINALLARRVSERAGCSVDVVKTGAAAVAAIESSLAPGGICYDLILMDVFMPDLDGLEATQAIKLLFCGRPDVVRGCPPIVALTANAFDEDRTRCLAAGMDDYLAKPFDARQLTGMLARWVSARGHAATG